MAVMVKSKLVGEVIPLDRQREIGSQVYDPEAFQPAVNGNLAPVQRIIGNLYWQNLSLGPTGSFKDFGLRSVGGDIKYALDWKDIEVDFFGSTSGDTGVAAMKALMALGVMDRGTLTIISGEGKVAPFQNAQMKEAAGGNTHYVTVRGAGFDECQGLVKHPFFKKFGAINSINPGRIFGQVPYYFSGYLQAIKASGGQIGDPVDFIVPSGNFGNVYSGYVARKMGLPIRNLIIATNENDVLDRLVKTGIYHNKGSVDTSSPSMDISVASNYERLLYELFEGDPERTGDYMREFSRFGKVALTDFGLPANSLRRLGIDSGSTTHAQRLDTIKWTMYTPHKQFLGFLTSLPMLNLAL